MMNDTYYRSGGAPIAIRRISQALAGADFSVAACKHDGREEDLTWVPEGRFARFDLTSSNNPILLFKELRRFRKWFKEQGCSLVHCHHRRLSVLVQLAGIPVVYTGQVAFPYVWWFRWLRPRRMTAVSPSVASNIFDNTGLNVITCINNPAQFPSSPPSIDVDKVKGRAVCVARLEPIKGHTYLLAAWKLLSDRGHRYELDLVGEGSLRAELEAQVQKDGIAHLVRFRGFTNDVAAITANSLFAILASEVEGHPLVALEAAGSGRASLVTAVPGSIDVLPPDRKLPNGIEYRDVKALADALEGWFARPEEVVEEGKRFFSFLKAESDPKFIAGKYQEVYTKILAGYA
jgi:glycosyltransferase involved in cell wall biosynthesis